MKKLLFLMGMFSIAWVQADCMNDCYNAYYNSNHAHYVRCVNNCG